VFPEFLRLLFVILQMFLLFLMTSSRQFDVLGHQSPSVWTKSLVFIIKESSGIFASVPVHINPANWNTFPLYGKKQLLSLYLWREQHSSGSQESASQYSHWLQGGRPRGQSLSLGWGNIFFFSMSSRPILGPTQSPIQWVVGALSPG
jgi:hypothetical protein